MKILRVVSFFYKNEKDLKEALWKAHILLDEFSISPPEKIKMKSISFEYGEGSTPNNSIPTVFSTWEEANDYIYRHSLRDKYSGQYEISSVKSCEGVRADLGARSY